MNFEDMQKEWRHQFPTPAVSRPTQAEAELLAQLRLQRRRFRCLSVLAVLSVGSVSAYLLFWTLVVARYSTLFPKELGPTFIIGPGLCMTICAVTLFFQLRWGRDMRFPSRGSALFPSAVHEHNRRGSKMTRWAYLMRILLGLFYAAIVLMATKGATGFYRMLDWIAFALFIISAASSWGHRLITQAQMPPVDNTLLGALAVSIHQTRRQSHFMANNWRYIGLLITGIFLLTLQTWLPKANLDRGWPSLVGMVILPVLIAFGVAPFGAWRLGRWVARNRLQPRLEQLERLRAELSNEPEASR
jgi:hypothetical protein